MGDFSGGGSDKSTSSSSTTNTTNQMFDRRQVIGEGAIGLASDSSTINVTNQTLDGGSFGLASNALAASQGVFNAALDTISSADATNSQGFSQLLTLADRLFQGGGDILSKTADTTLAQVAALNTAQNDSGGKIDQKTIMIAVGVAGAVAIAFATAKGNK